MIAIMPTSEQILDKLNDVMDPELNMSITDLGLVYNVGVKNEKAHILMTLTSLGCPLFDTIQDEIYHNLEMIGVSQDQVEIELTFDPPWSIDRMSERAKAMLGI